MLGRRIIERPSANRYVGLQVRTRLLEIREGLVLWNIGSGRRNNLEGDLDNLVVSTGTVHGPGFRTGSIDANA